MNVSPSSVALSSGNSRSASIVARAMNASPVSLRSRRRFSTRVMSTSTIVVQVAAVSSDAFMWRPIDWRMRDSGPLEPAATSGAGAGAGTGAGATSGSGRPSRDFGLPAAAGASGRYGDSMCIGGSVAAPLPPLSR